MPGTRATSVTRRTGERMHAGYVLWMDWRTMRWRKVWLQVDAQLLTCYSTNSTLNKLVCRPVCFKHVRAFYGSLSALAGAAVPETPSWTSSWHYFAFDTGATDDSSRASSPVGSAGHDVSSDAVLTALPVPAHLFRIKSRIEHTRWVSALRTSLFIREAEAAAAANRTIGGPAGSFVDSLVEEALAAAGSASAPASLLCSPETTPSEPPSALTPPAVFTDDPPPPAEFRLAADTRPIRRVGHSPGRYATGGRRQGRMVCEPPQSLTILRREFSGMHRLRASDTCSNSTRTPPGPSPVFRDDLVTSPPMPFRAKIQDRGISTSRSPLRAARSPAMGHRRTVFSPGGGDHRNRRASPVSSPPTRVQCAAPPVLQKSPPQPRRRAGKAHADPHVVTDPAPRPEELMGRLASYERDREELDARLHEEKTRLESRRQAVDAKEEELLRRQAEIDTVTRERRAEVDAQARAEKDKWIQVMKSEVETEWQVYKDRMQQKEAELRSAQEEITRLREQIVGMSARTYSRPPGRQRSLSPDQVIEPIATPSRPELEEQATPNRAAKFAQSPPTRSPAARTHSAELSEYLRASLSAERQDDIEDLDAALDDILRDAAATT